MSRRAANVTQAEPGAVITDVLRLDIERGRRMFRDRKRPPECPDDEAWGRNRQSAEWLGYQSAKIDEFWKRRRVMDLLGVEDTDEDC